MSEPTRAALPEPAWHTKSADETLAALGTTARGLSSDEARRRLARHGENRLPEGRARPLWRMLLDQFSDFMILVLIAAAIVAGLVGEPGDSVAILVIVVLNGAIGFFQERRAQSAMAALRKLAAHSARARRDGAVTALPAHLLVPGDLVLLEAGDVVPADLRLLECARLAIAEASLTGESVPVDKDSRALPAPDAPLGDRRSMAYKGTLVTHGRGLGVVIATGLSTELGRIAGLLEGAHEPKTPLQRRLARFGTRLAWAVLAICVIVFVAGLLRGEEPTLMFLTAVSLAVAAIPEALPAVVVIALSLGAARMVKQRALIRRLPAVETLGSVTTICSDKTGTLTQNAMVAETLLGPDATPLPADSPPAARLHRAMALVNDATLADTGVPIGDPTETALLVAARDRGLAPSSTRAAWPRVSELPFDSERKRMSTLHAAPHPSPTPVLLCAKGAPESLLPLCTHLATPTGERPLTPSERETLLAAADRLAAAGQRVLAFAERHLVAVPAPETLTPGDLERDLTVLGLVGLLDPPRPEAAAAVAECKAAGIVPVMITGDHPLTARAIASRLGIASAGSKVITGPELEALSEHELEAALADVHVYARVDPSQKIRIVQALQARGELVAMTGDGVNDAPALKRAEIGVAMGEKGTDVAREAAHMVLLDDNFATIVKAVREGRVIFDNIRKFIQYTMTSNAGEIWTLFLAPLLGLPIPLLPIHILWINLVTDGLPGLALTAERAERDVMTRPPRPPDESVFARGMWQHIAWVGLLMGGVCIATQAIAIAAGAHWQTMVFTVLCLSQLGNVLAIRSERDSLFAMPANRPLALTVALTLLLQLLTIYVPTLNAVFKTEPLTLAELAVALLASSLVFFALELEKLLRRRRRPAGPP